MTPDIMAWGQMVITRDDVRDQDVLEVGASDVNGSLRPYIEALGPRSYVGVDPDPGTVDPLTSTLVASSRVDVVASGEELVERFGPDRFGLVVSTEMLEHAEHWQEVVWNMMAVTEPGGVMVVTTRGPGFPYHPFPEDHWRYTVGDFEAIWAGWQVNDLREDPGNPGVFIKATKPTEWDAEAEADRLSALTVQAQRKTY